MDLQSKLLKERLTKAVNDLGTNERQQINFLKDCLIRFGHLDPSVEVEDPDEYTEDYAQMADYAQLDRYNTTRYTAPTQQPAEYDLYADIQGLQGPQFSRTFIQTDEPGKLTRLEKVQRRGIDTLETELAQLGEKYDEVFTKISNLAEPDRVKRFAMNMYTEILNYYTTNVHQLPINKGALKRGYIMLCLYYAMIEYNFYISHQKLVNLFGGRYSTADIPEAEKFLAVIFKGKYSNLFTSNIQERNMCNMRTKLSRETIEKIENVMKNVRGIFGNILTPVQIAACIYYVTNKISGRIKITNEEGIPSFVTYELLSKNCDGSPSRAPIDAAVKRIAEFFDKHPELL